MRILLCAGRYKIGGFSVVMEQLATKFVEQGHDITLGALWFLDNPPKSAYKISSIPFYNPIKLKKFLDGFDIIHSHHAITNYLALATRKPFVYHYHGAPNSRRGFLFKLNMISSLKMMKHKFDAVISVSNSGAVELKQFFSINDVDIIYNGVDSKIFKPGLDAKYRKGKPQILFVGNLYPHKNLEELVLAMGELINTYPLSYLQIVGDGKMYSTLNRLINERNLENNVELVGRVSGEELPFYYSSCDIYVTPSRWELFGLPLLEAMACGKPVLASSIPPHIELLTKSNAGQIYELGNVSALYNKMITTYEERETYKVHAMQFAKKQDWSIVADKVLKRYSHLIFCG